MSWLLPFLTGTVVILAITAVTGYFVAQEFAYMAVDRARLSARAASGDAAAERALSVTRRTSFLLSGAQLGITVTGLLVGYVAEPLVGRALSDLLGGVGVPTGVGLAVGTILALALSTVVQMLFGELFPKNLAIARPEVLAIRLARSTVLYLAVFGWLIRVFDSAANALLRLVGVEPVHDVEHSATARDLEHIVADSRASGDLSDDLSMLLDRVLDFPRQDVEHAMIPRARVDAVDSDATVESVRALMAAGHSRYPVIGPDDSIVGVVHLGDLLAAQVGPGASVQAVRRPPLVIPTTMALPAALRLLSASDAQLACVVDEYGGFAGVLTVEDIAEELVGEIADEHDHHAEAELSAAVGEGAWEVAGDMHVDELERTIGHDLPAGDFETVAGLAIAVHGALPPIGSIIDVDLPEDPGGLVADDPPPGPRLSLEVLEVERHVPTTLRVTLVEHPVGDESR